MGNVTSALVGKNFASIISNKTRHYKMSARAVHSKNRMTQQTEKTLEGLYRYYCYAQLNLQSILLTAPTLTLTFKCLLRPKFSIVCVYTLLFPAIISIIPEIILNCFANKNMKDADHFFFYTTDPWPDSSGIIMFPTSPYCKYMLVNISMNNIDDRPLLSCIASPSCYD